MRKYIIQPGDTYSSIARKFNVSVQDLKSLNAYEDRKLPIGQSISIPESKKEVSPTKISDSDTPADSMAKENAIPNNPGLKSTTDALLKPLLTDKRKEEQTPNLNPTNNVIVETGLNMVREQKKKVIDAPKKFNLAAVLNTVTSNLEILRSYDYPRMRDERSKVETRNDIHNRWSNTDNKKDSEIIAQAIDKWKEALGIKIRKENKNEDEITTKVTKENYLQIYEGDNLFAEYKPNKHEMIELPADNPLDRNGQFTVNGIVVYNYHNRNDEKPNNNKELDQWGKPENISKFIRLAINYKTQYPGEILSFGDLSTDTGGSPRFKDKKGNYRPHKSHFKGSQADLRYPSSKGLNTSRDELADVKKTDWILENAKYLGFNIRIVGLNISKMTKFHTSTNYEHNTHIHLGFK